MWMGKMAEGRVEILFESLATVRQIHLRQKKRKKIVVRRHVLHVPQQCHQNHMEVCTLWAYVHDKGTTLYLRHVRKKSYSSSEVNQV